MKRGSYIALFTTLGFLLSMLVHAAIEIPMILLLVRDFETYSLGFSWEAWQRMHDIGTPFLALAGVILGYRQGLFWWDAVYTRRLRARAS